MIHARDDDAVNPAYLNLIKYGLFEDKYHTIDGTHQLATTIGFRTFLQASLNKLTILPWLIHNNSHLFYVIPTPRSSVSKSRATT